MRIDDASGSKGMQALHHPRPDRSKRLVALEDVESPGLAPSTRPRLERPWPYGPPCPMAAMGNHVLRTGRRAWLNDVGAQARGVVIGSLSLGALAGSHMGPGIGVAVGGTALVYSLLALNLRPPSPTLDER